ncbi:uncharacterized protein LOC126616562 [Malus sylvestris]|uniref:uncharacterized protein LOC126616562 n=1 Tax=Malus sylvestris TaxID=3752 RepID=UPI0021AC9CA6|nr:uncharacterized protein LOC126616562 [Malus sylvestris]
MKCIATKSGYTVEDDFQQAKAVFDFIGDPRRSDLTGDSAEDGPPSTIPWMVIRVSAKISDKYQYAFVSNPDVDIPVEVQISSSRAFIGESLGGELLQGAFYCQGKLIGNHNLRISSAVNHVPSCRSCFI